MWRTFQVSWIIKRPCTQALRTVIRFCRSYRWRRLTPVSFVHHQRSMQEFLRTLTKCHLLAESMNAIFRNVRIDRNSIKHMDNQQRVFEKQQEIEDLSNVSKLEDAKQEKQHLTEENERLKQERAVKIQLSKQPGSYSYGHTLGTLSCVRYKVGFHRLPFSLYRRLSVDRQA